MKLAELWWSIAQEASEKTSDRLEASRLLADRGWGKSVDLKPLEAEDPLGLEEAREKLMGRLKLLEPKKDPQTGAIGGARNTSAVPGDAS
jgi:hypothetical protein